jgi:hypothetical protein
MSNVKKLAEIVLREHLEDIALDIIQAKEWLSTFDDLPIKTYIQITWSILRYEDELDVTDEKRSAIKTSYEEMMLAREPYEPLEWDYVSIEHLVSMLAGFYEE